MSRVPVHPALVRPGEVVHGPGGLPQELLDKAAEQALVAKAEAAAAEARYRASQRPSSTDDPSDDQSPDQPIT